MDYLFANGVTIEMMKIGTEPIQNMKLLYFVIVHDNYIRTTKWNCKYIYAEKYSIFSIMLFLDHSGTSCSQFISGSGSVFSFSFSFGTQLAGKLAVFR